MTDPTRALVERFIAAYNAFDVEGMLALLDPDVVFAVDLSPELRAGETLRLGGRSRYRTRSGRIVHLVDVS